MPYAEKAISFDRAAKLTASVLSGDGNADADIAAQDLTAEACRRQAKYQYWRWDSLARQK